MFMQLVITQNSLENDQLGESRSRLMPERLSLGKSMFYPSFPRKLNRAACTSRTQLVLQFPLVKNSMAQGAAPRDVDGDVRASTRTPGTGVQAATSRHNVFIYNKF